VELVETTVEIGGLALSFEHPPDPLELIDEEAFERDEFLPYWAEIWPSAVALARTVAELELDARPVLELGCGLALPSIVAALGGADVLATDWSADALAFAERNASRNGADLRTRLVAWADAADLVEDGPWSLVLASDVLYERRNVAPLLALLPQLGGDVFVADPGRPALRPFLDGAAASWTITAIAAPELPRGAVHRLHAR
jgi:predicted nicotinamide N-methyase